MILDFCQGTDLVGKGQCLCKIGKGIAFAKLENTVDFDDFPSLK